MSADVLLGARIAGHSSPTTQVSRAPLLILRWSGNGAVGFSVPVRPIVELRHNSRTNIRALIGGVSCAGADNSSMISQSHSRLPLFLLPLLARLAVVFVFFSVPVGASTAAEGHTNLLIDSASPYLLQHARNPVDWYPWGEEAIKKAKNENKLIFLSIGYSTCYWCHVAERTIYSNPGIAGLMNQWFVNIKVDREERPDLDATFMLARQALTGSGGWPNNLFLTPDLKPFFAGSYFPPEDQGETNGFPTILKLIHEDWEENPAKIKDTRRSGAGCAEAGARRQRQADERPEDHADQLAGNSA